MPFIFGGSRFGARAYANNLEEKLMLEAIDYAHLQGVSLYLTVNTLMKEKELEELYSFLKPYYEQGLDGVIVQDLGAVSYIRQQFPDLAIHASTQMTLCGSGGVQLLKEAGFSEWCWRGNSLLRRLPGSIRIQGWSWSVLSMVRFVTVIPDSACSAVFWAEEAATADAVHSPAVWHMKPWQIKRRCLKREHRRF